MSTLATGALLSTTARTDAADALNVTVAAKARQLAGGQALHLRLLMPNGCEANLRPLVQRFFEQTGIRVDTVVTPVDDINTVLLLDSMSGDGHYDLALPATFGLPDLVSSGAILPLSEYADRHEPAGFRDGILYGIGDRHDGELYGFQTDGDAYLMFYNRHFLDDEDARARYADRFGTPLDVPATWNELDRQMAFFHAPDAGRHGGLLFRTPGYLAWEWWARFHAKGVWPLSETMVPQIDSAAGVDALEEMIRATESLAPDTRSLGLFENWTRFAQGDVYCNIGWGGTQKHLNREGSVLKHHLAYGPTPGGLIDGQLLTTPYFNWGWNYVVTNTSEHPELAYLFALFASTPAESTLAVRQVDGYFDPFHAEHYSDPGIRDAYSPEFLAVHESSLRSAIPDLYLAGQGQYFRTLNDWLDRALSGQVSAEKALTLTAQQWDIITHQNGRGRQIERWMSLRERYPVNARALLRDV